MMLGIFSIHQSIKLCNRIYWKRILSNNPQRNVNPLYPIRRLSSDPPTASKNILPFLLADIGEGITEVQILQWYVKEGDQVNQFDKIAEVQSDKASVEITSRYDGKIGKIYGKVGSIVKVGQPLVDIDTGLLPSNVDSLTQKASVLTSQDPVVIKEEEEEDISSIFSTLSKKILATPAVRAAAKLQDLDLKSGLIVGSGIDGRILHEDLKSHLKHPPSISGESPSSSNSFIDREPTIIQKAMIRSMQSSLAIPHFGYSEEVQVDSLLQLRDELRKNIQRSQHESPSLSFLPFLIKVTSQVLEDFPILNSKLLISNENFTIRTFQKKNIGIAMDTPNGLLVPVIKDVSKKSILEIAEELKHLVIKGKNRQLGKDDLSEGTFTLSNIGSIGTGYSAFPIIQSPQVCIGALTRIQRKLLVKKGNFDNILNNIKGLDPSEGLKVCSILRIDWSADHRIIDGATMALFSAAWKKLAENPKSIIDFVK